MSGFGATQRLANQRNNVPHSAVTAPAQDRKRRAVGRAPYGNV